MLQEGQDFTETHLLLPDNTLAAIIHNLPTTGSNNIEDAFTVWLAKTDKHTDESFCDYINEKREKGLCDFYAFPSKESFQDWLEEQGMILDADEELEDNFTDSDMRIIQLNHQVHKIEFDFNNKNYSADITPYDITSKEERLNHKLHPDSYLIKLYDGSSNIVFPVYTDDHFQWVTSAPKDVINDPALIEKIADMIMDIYT